MRWAGHVARMGDRRRVYSVSVVKAEVKRTLGRPRSSWEANIEKDLQEVESGDMDWIEVFQEGDIWRTLVNAVTNFLVP